MAGSAYDSFVGHRELHETPITTRQCKDMAEKRHRVALQTAPDHRIPFPTVENPMANYVTVTELPCGAAILRRCDVTRCDGQPSARAL